MPPRNKKAKISANSLWATALCLLFLGCYSQPPKVPSSSAQASGERTASCRNLEKLGALIYRYAREHGGRLPGGGPSGLRFLQRLAEKYGGEVQGEIFLSPRTKHVAPTRLPNGVLRITRRTSSYRTRALDARLADINPTTLLTFEVKTVRGAGRCVLLGDFQARWMDDESFKRCARNQNLFGLPDELR